MEPLRADMFDEICPSTLNPFRFGRDKWAALVIACLEDGPRRFSELRVPLHRVTPKVLTQSLRHLEQDGLITVPSTPYRCAASSTSSPRSATACSAPSAPPATGPPPTGTNSSTPANPACDVVH